MSVYNRIYADAADADGSGSHSVYATARASTAATTASNTIGAVGQGLFGGPTYAVYQTFEVFNTSALPTGIPTATLSISQFNSLLASEDTIEVRAVSAVTNLIAGNSLAAQTPLFGSLAFPTTSGRKTISFADISALPRTSSCKLLFHSQNQRTSTAPTASSEQINFYCADQTGTTNDPYLETVGGWSIVGVGTVVEAATTAITLTEPAGVANGDLLVACFASRTTATTAVSNTGWTAVNSQNNNNTSATAGSAVASGTMLYQVRAGTPDLSFVVPAGISVIRGQIVAYRGNAATTPLDVSTAGTTGAVTAVSVTGLTTTQDDDLIVAMAAGGQEATWSAFNNVTTPLTASGATDTTTAPSTTAWIERAESITTTGADTSIAIFDAIRTTTGATGNLTVTASIASGHVVVAGAFKIAAAGPTAYTLPAVAGSYAVTGTAASLERGREVEALAGAYALTGTATTLSKVVSYRLASDAGSYALSGATAGLYRGREVLAVAGSYGLSGTAASLEAGREVAADPGSYALAGTATSLELGKEVPALAGSYSLAGAATTLRYDRKPVAVSGAYALSGTAATLRHAWRTAAVAGSYAITGAAAAFVRTWRTTAVAGSYGITGTPANLLTVGARAIIGLPGSYALTGTIASLEVGREVDAVAGAYALSGTAASLEHGREVPAIAGSYALTGAAATFRHAWRMGAVSGSYTISGTPANLLRLGAYAIIGLPGAYALAGSAAILEKESALAVASLAFDATDLKGLGGFGTETYTVTVAEAAGQERLVFLAAVSNNSTADFIDCTIDGQTAVRVGTLSVGAGSNPCVITAYRAPGTANTSIDIVVTIENSAYASYCACYKLSNAGALLATTNVSGGDPTLDVDTAAGGTTAAALLGYSDVAGPTVSWTGLAEDFDGVSTFGDEVFSGASADNATAAAPLAIAADSTVAASVASLVVSFRLAAAAAAFDANSIGSAPDRTFSLAVAEAEGQERLIVLAAVTNGATADFSAVTVDGETATRIGSLSQGALDGGGNRAIITAWRAPGTAGTAIDVDVTIDGDVYSSYCACFRLADAGVAVSINVAGNDPNLSIDTTADGAVVAATLGYVGGGLTPNTAWSGLTERFDGVTVFGDEVFSGASSDLGIGTAETPRPIAADFDETLLGATSSVASIVLAFPYAVAAEAATYTLAAAAGSYALSGTAATLSKAIASTYTLAAGAGSYGLAGAAAVIGHGLIVEAGSYALTGGSATLTKLGVGDRLLPAGAGSYQLTGSPVSLIWSGEVPIVTSGQADGDIVRRRTQKRRARIFYIVSETAKKIVERPGPLRKKRKKLAKAIAEEVLEAAGGLLAPDRLALEQAIRRRLEALPLTELHTEGWSELQDRLMQVIADAEEIAQRLRAEQEEEDDLLLLLAS